MNVLLSLTAVLIFLFIVNFIITVILIQWYNRIMKSSDDEDVVLFAFAMTAFTYVGSNIAIITALTA